MVEEKKAWQTDDPNIFSIGGCKVSIAKKGREQAVQIERLNKWLKEHIAPLTETLKAGTDQTTMGLGLLLASMGELTVESQFELAKTIVGDKDVDGALLPADFLDKYYDIEWVEAGLQLASRGAAAQRLLMGFFTSMT
jgi:hypothetical protein